jgi:hypothetical protein
MVRIRAVALLVAVALGAGCAGDDDQARVSDAQQDRLLTTCLAAVKGTPQQCPSLVDEIVRGVGGGICGYTEAAELLANVITRAGSKSQTEIDELDARHDALNAQCAGGG